MHRVAPRLCTMLVSVSLAGVGAAAPRAADGQDAAGSLEALGESLFFDTDLSRNRTQACATCHDPAHGFADARGGAVSVGDDGTSLGTRNAPTAGYAAFSPSFHINAKGDPVGGQFLDGRAATLEMQAGDPLLNPVEMAMPDKASVVARIKEKPSYVEAFRQLFGQDVFDDDEHAFGRLRQAIAAFERTPKLSPFDSKYDRYLRGEYEMTPQEELGRVLFFSNQFTNCQLCHRLNATGLANETFSNYQFHNIGVPANPDLDAPVDRGLLSRFDIEDPRHDGQFKVPPLRNVAVTGPYMHNGVFKELRTVVLFYDKYNATAPRRQINPETGEAWAAPEVPEAISREELEFGPPLDDRRVDALVAFLRTLTDRRYEALLDK